MLVPTKTLPMIGALLKTAAVQMARLGIARQEKRTKRSVSEVDMRSEAERCDVVANQSSNG